LKYNMKNCPKVPLTDLLTFVVDNRGKTVPTAKTGHVLIATNCVKNESLYPVFEKVRYLSNETYKTWFRAHLLPGDILFVNKGTPGRVCMVPDPVNFCIAQDMVALRVDFCKVYNKYLFAVLRGREIQMHVYNTSVGDVIPHFKKSYFNQLLIPLPSMEIQRIIGDVYFDLSEKVANNTKINRHLEQMAQVIFKSWFVDFEPSIPFTKVIQVLGGGTPKTGTLEYWSGSIPFFTPKDANGTYVLTTEKNLTEIGLNKCNSKLYPVNTVFVTARGTVGKLALAGRAMAMNQSCYALVGKEGHWQYYVYHLAQNVIENLKHKASGAVFDAIVTRDFESELVPNIQENEILNFEKMVAGIYEAILNNTNENTCLAAIRDTLLPWLMAGNLCIPAR